jgi:hypothetical protein
VTIYYKMLEAGPPKCCHSCEMYGTDGLCVEFFKEPPEEFAATPDACNKWVMDLPF